MAKIDLLKPRVKELAEKLCDECKKVCYNIVLTHTLRTIAEQDELYAQGRTKPGEIVTKAKGGFSFHNFGVAFDICPIVNGKAEWNDTALFKKIGEIGMKLGLEWGGIWTSFPDLPHFQYTAGYSLADFRNNKIGWKRFEMDNENTSLPSQDKIITLKVSTQEGLNVRTGPSMEQNKLGKLVFGEQVMPLEKINGWVKIEIPADGAAGFFPNRKNPRNFAKIIFLLRKSFAKLLDLCIPLRFAPRSARDFASGWPYPRPQRGGVFCQRI